MAQLPQLLFGDGHDGTKTVSGTETLNGYYPCTGTATESAIAVASGDEANFSAGDLVMLHKSRGNTTTDAGVWEILTVDSTADTVVNFTTALVNAYQSKSQAVIIPQYTTFSCPSSQTLSATAWDEDIGGIACIVASVSATFGGTGNLDGLGYRNNGIGRSTAGDQGEGTGGAGNISHLANGNGGGASGNGSENTGGGGGNAAAGAVGQSTETNEKGLGGEAAGNVALTEIVFGGEGGGGSLRDTPHGGNGGGLIIVISKSITVSGAIQTTGAGGSNSDGSAGGGGAGGSVLLKGTTVTIGTNLITASKGTGGTMTDSPNNKGGDGSVGRIRVEYGTSLSGSTNDPTASTSQEADLTTTSTSTSTSTTTSTSTSSTTTSSSTTTTTSTSTTTTSTSTSTSTSSTTTSSSTTTTTSTSTSTSSTTTSSSTTTTTSTTTTLANSDFKRKRYNYRIYNKDLYVTTWADEVISEPVFRNIINGGPGELIVKLARKFDDFGEDVDVTLNYKVELYVFDRESPNGVLLYTGFISGYRPVLDGPVEFVEITILSYVFELSGYMLRDSGGDTEIAYNSQNPTDILKDVIDKYRADGGTLNYTASSVDDTNSTVSYTFNNNTVKEAIDKIIELSPQGWYWNVDPDGTVNFKAKAGAADHIFNIGSHIVKMETWRRIEDVVNRVYFTGFTTASGTGLYRTYDHTGSITSWGLRALNRVDHRVTNPDTADIMSNRILNAKNQPEIRTLITIADNNGEAEKRGYDIESVQPGETMEVGNLKESTKTRSLWDTMIWESDVWDQTIASAAADVVQIMSVEYMPTAIRIEASSRTPEIPKRIEDINRNLENTQTTNNPATPIVG